MEPVAEFDDRLWGAMVDYVTVGVDGAYLAVHSFFCFT